MTDIETLNKLAQISAEAEQRRADVNTWERDARRLALNAWANENHRFNIGDIIRYGDITIRVDRYSGEEYRGKLYVTYHGHVLTKALKLRADGWVTDIYDDGREIEKIK